MEKISTSELLRVFFGLQQTRSMKKKEVHEVLVQRGVSPTGITIAIEDILFQIGNAADNRIEDIDAQLDWEEEKDNE